jgi:DNA-binding transcriptional regulator GbsR (MarR family)
VHKVWVKGDRKDYYEADDWFGNILKNAVIDSVGKRLAQSTALLEEIDADLEGGNGDDEFIKDRIAAIRRFQDKAQKVWNSPVVRMLLK